MMVPVYSAAPGDTVRAQHRTGRACSRLRSVLRALGWSAVAISAVLSAALITGVLLTLFAGRSAIVVAVGGSSSLMRPLRPLPDWSRCYPRSRALGVAAMVAASAVAATVRLAHSLLLSRHGWPKPWPRCVADQSTASTLRWVFWATRSVRFSPPPRQACTRSCPVRSPIDRSSFSRPLGHCCVVRSFSGRRTARQGNPRHPLHQPTPTASNGRRTGWFFV